MNNPAITQAIMGAEARRIFGLKLAVPELFAEPGFQAFVNSSNVMTWHDRKGLIGTNDIADVVAFVDPSLTGEGTDCDMPYWDVIIEKLKAALGPAPGPFSEHLVVVLTNQ
ncbi:hypothetical protein GR140_30515 (plasmid) [Pseudomonas putida]|uniref:hypothetical protein n=1 Tax=Pseudomonas putida TaxID=303 RepID=UPI001BAF94E4|nr:hypothetical protein [Pseudomonas putida]QUG93102.1 hypothetical protein GR140_30515 [Pseudomonas putida]